MSSTMKIGQQPLLSTLSLNPLGKKTKPTQGSVQLPVAAVIVVITIRDDRKEAVLAAIRQLNRGDTFLDAFLDRKATVVKKFRPRKYKVILMYKEAYL